MESSNGHFTASGTPRLIPLVITEKARKIRFFNKDGQMFWSQNFFLLQVFTVGTYRQLHQL